MVGPSKPKPVAPPPPKYSTPGVYGNMKDVKVTPLPRLDPERTMKVMKDPIRRKRLEDEVKRSNDESLGGQRRRRNHLLRGL